jgi:AcrR family transcriptional regulator
MVRNVTTQRRLGAENAKNRTLLVEAAEQIFREGGYAAVTARSVAAKAGLKVQLVYYYFQTMDDLILAFVRRNTAKRIERFVQALVAAEPLRALWELNSDFSNGIVSAELVAAANHREAIRTEIVAAAKQFRTLQIAAVGQLLAAKGVDLDAYPAAGIVTIVVALARSMAQDMALGLDDGYAEATMIVERCLDYYCKSEMQTKTKNSPKMPG